MIQDNLNVLQDLKVEVCADGWSAIGKITAFVNIEACEDLAMTMGSQAVAAELGHQLLKKILER